MSAPTKANPQFPLLPGATLGVLGGGQLGRMFAHAAQAMGYFTAVLDPAKFTQATHFPDGYIRSGTPVRVNDLTDITPWADAAGAKLGFIGGDFPVNGAEKLNVHVITHPETIKLDRLPVTFTAPATASVPHINFVTGV